MDDVKVKFSFYLFLSGKRISSQIYSFEVIIQTVTVMQKTADSNEAIMNSLFYRRTLVSKEPLSMLARMFSLEGRLWPAALDKHGAFLIDRWALTIFLYIS